MPLPYRLLAHIPCLKMSVVREARVTVPSFKACNKGEVNGRLTNGGTQIRDMSPASIMREICRCQERWRTDLDAYQRHTKIKDNDYWRCENSTNEFINQIITFLCWRNLNRQVDVGIELVVVANGDGSRGFRRACGGNWGRMVAPMAAYIGGGRGEEEEGILKARTFWSNMSEIRNGAMFFKIS